MLTDGICAGDLVYPSPFANSLHSLIHSYCCLFVIGGVRGRTVLLRRGEQYLVGVLEVLAHGVHMSPVSIDALFYRVVWVVRVVRVGIVWVMYVPVDGEVGAGVLGAVGRRTCGGR
jgi:hypothetical protein